jgi:hypothetical protein
MSPSSKSLPKQKIGKRERFFWQAAIAALVVHVVVLGALAEWGGLPPAANTQYAEVGFADYLPPERTMTMEEAVKQQMEARMEEALRNVSADASAASSDELRSSVAASEQMARDVEAELRAFEQSAFEALAEGRDDQTGGSDNPEASPTEVQNQYEGWDARYQGQVTAAYDLAGRKALFVDVPGYRCRGGGAVVVTVEVTPGGEVVDAQLTSISETGSQALAECLVAESLRSALKCRFQSQADAPKRQQGTLTYRFIAQ